MRIKDIVNIRNEKIQQTDLPYIALENIRSWDATFIETDAATEGINNIFKKGDILFGKLRPYLAKGYIPEYDGICSSEFLVMFAKKGYSNRYLLYYFLSHSVIDYIRNQVAGVKMPRTNWSSFSSIEIEPPTLADQQRIVDYLDEKTKAIDNHISVLEKKSETYTRLKASIINRAVTRGLNPNVILKDSCIEWIGMIPERWNPIRLKDVSYLYSGLTGKAGDDFRCDDESLTKPYLPFTNVLNNTKIDFNQVNRVVMGENENQNRVNQNDLIFLMSSEDYESIAKSAVVEGDPGELYLNSFCRGLHFTSRNVLASFVNYQLNSKKYRDALRFEARGFTRINIKIDRIASQFVTLPPLDEQQQIVDYLDAKCTEIDKAIENIGKQIDALKRLKRSLINEVVTGKRKV